MADKKETEKATEENEKMEEKDGASKKRKQEDVKREGGQQDAASVISKQQKEGSLDKEEDEQLTSLDLLWRHAFNELDQWAAQLEARDEVFLKEAMYFVDSVKRKQGNLKTVAEQFNKEFLEWERVARDEFLMSTTTIQHFFPRRSYEDINEQIDKIQKRTMSILKTPYQVISNNQIIDRYLQLIEQYIALRKKGREQYIKSIKQAASLIYENQKGFVHLFANQIKTLVFPLNKYLEKTEELSKS